MKPYTERRWTTCQGSEKHEHRIYVDPLASIPMGAAQFKNYEMQLRPSLCYMHYSLQFDEYNSEPTFPMWEGHSSLLVHSVLSQSLLKCVSLIIITQVRSYGCTPYIVLVIDQYELHDYVLSVQFTHMRLIYLHHHIIIRHIGNSSPTLYNYILANNSHEINQDISIQHHISPNQSHYIVYFNITSSLNTKNHH